MSFRKYENCGLNVLYFIGVYCPWNKSNIGDWPPMVNNKTINIDLMNI
ncbi:hypothetical protein HMPREF0454_01278 [Hafnia alvei ATCC 51873]|uniref:Uncharacterized protein n=1 Tax=Hafnia alvei ATCC 51873 TaxID=1002364 RepID=G9Y3Z8_HAFAL|nr:hypothetical protein HMPREF0454_01278 [Hafnia alvei ATCC 51873]